MYVKRAMKEIIDISISNQVIDPMISQCKYFSVDNSH